MDEWYIQVKGYERDGGRSILLSYSVAVMLTGKRAIVYTD